MTAAKPRCAKSPPDGYTLMLGGGGETAANGALFKSKITYDPVKDLLPIHIAAKALIVLMVHSGTPSRRLQTSSRTRRRIPASCPIPPQA